MHCGDELTCVICMRLLFQAVTTACGHTFCKECLKQSLLTSKSCPLCRTLIPYFPDGVTSAIDTYIRMAYPKKYERRRLSENWKEKHLPILPTLQIPFNVDTQTGTQLNITENRYLEMFRGLINAKKTKFCVLPYFEGLDGSFSLVCVGSLVEIINHHWNNDNTLDINIRLLYPVQVLKKKLISNNFVGIYWEAEDIIQIPYIEFS